MDQGLYGWLEQIPNRLKFHFRRGHIHNKCQPSSSGDDRLPAYMTCHKLSYQIGLMLVRAALYVPRFDGAAKRIWNVKSAPESIPIF